MNLQHRTHVIQALSEVARAFASRGKVPSAEVLRKAAAMLARRGAHHHHAPARVYWIPGDGDDYMVALYLGDDPETGEMLGCIIAAECSCPYRGELVEADERSEIGPCSHLLDALTLARLDGLRIKVSS